MQYTSKGYEALVREEEKAAEKMLKAFRKHPELVDGPEITAFKAARDKAHEYYQNWMEQRRAGNV